MTKRYYFLSFIIFIFCCTVSAQTKKTGPIILDYGKVYTVENPHFKVDPTKTYKAVFDIMDSPDDPTKLNATIETAARFLNMHAQQGVPAEQLIFALVVHHKASKDMSNNEAYKKRYGTDNPNLDLINSLLSAGGRVVFCGQSSAARGIPREDLIEGVELSLSAMTALIQLQDDNYRLIKF